MALLHTLSKNDQIGICSFVRRVNTVPRIVALVPQVINTINNRKSYLTSFKGGKKGQRR